MIAVDAGPLIALLDREQGVLHRQCLAVSTTLAVPLITTWPCLSKAWSFLGDLQGWAAQKALWQLLERQVLKLHKASLVERQRMQALRQRYRTMEWPEASLVSLAEARHLTTIWTLDTAFSRYKIHDEIPFVLVPLPPGVVASSPYES